MSHLLGIDLGTSSVKAAMIDSNTLRVIASAGQEYPVQQPQPGYAEQNPEDWWQATVSTVRSVLREVDPSAVRGIGLSGQMHGLVMIGPDQIPIHPAIIWADTRSAAQVAALKDEQAALQTTLPGQPAAGFMAATALWLHDNHPSLLDNTQVCLLPKDYLRLKLTGTVGTDPSDAAATWLFDSTAGEWSMEIVERCGLRRDQMPGVYPSHTVAGSLTAEAAQALGLPQNIPVVMGSADLPAQALGYGIIAPGRVLVTVGTGGQAFTPLNSPQPDPDLRYYVFNHNLPDTWYAQAAILSAGLSLRWLRDLLGMAGDPDAYRKLSALASEIPPGAEGLLFLPYLAGERTPHMDANASGLFFGLRLNHGAGHLARAVMEGVGFALKDCLALVAPGATEILLSGGAAKSAVWRQTLADIWQVPVRLADEDAPHACTGAAILAGVGAGKYKRIQDAVNLLPESETMIMPQDSNAELYAERYALYRHLYPTLRGDMHWLQA